jgi:LDH2 family malate/lactate/ureidoglycolate dehydrogenase
MANTVVAAGELERLAREALARNGVPEVVAADVARILVLGDLFGIHTHGVQRVPEYLSRVRAAGIDPTAEIVVRRLAPGVTSTEGGNGLGPAVGMRTLRSTMECARETGVGVGFARGSNHFGAVMPYSFLAAEEGFASIICSNATTTMAPWGGREARVGNSPFAIGAPCPGGEPIILDVALSVVARAKIRAAANKGEQIPDSWATDGAGLPTTDPHAALEGFLQPIGGHKGYGLAVMVDMLAGVLSGASFLTNVSSWSTHPGAAQGLGHFFVLIDTRRLGDSEWLAARVTEFAEILRSTPPADPAQPVRVPGEAELALYRSRLDEGVSLDVADVEALRGLAAPR